MQQDQLREILGVSLPPLAFCVSSQHSFDKLIGRLAGMKKLACR
jgi:hypothetical protein